ncbi:hypothetical protein TELCIR_17884 [Teladorsagia circumcincta]|uniref:Uncharacterized protein n=1 Tax=Teladorsagia circumcincta TaxID=45464 RepID=A0A2G9TRI5_TELCI|nr:hypothetical protein TELCIR_17884 [Teladorsagia circumcincta]
MPTAVCIDDIERSTAHKYTFLSETSKRTDGVPFSEELSNDELEIYEGAKLCPTQQEISYRRRLDGVLTSMFDKVEKLKKGSGETVKGDRRRYRSISQVIAHINRGVHPQKNDLTSTCPRVCIITAAL